MAIPLLKSISAVKLFIFFFFDAIFGFLVVVPPPPHLDLFIQVPPPPLQTTNISSVKYLILILFLIPKVVLFLHCQSFTPPSPQSQTLLLLVAGTEELQAKLQFIYSFPFQIHFFLSFILRRPTDWDFVV